MAARRKPPSAARTVRKTPAAAPKPQDAQPGPPVSFGPRVCAELASAEARDRSARRRVGAAWALLFFNTLTYAPVPGYLLHFPSHVGKGLAQGALPLALLVALTANPKVRLRPNVFLCLVCLLVVDTVITAAAAPHLGTEFRTFRLAEFVAALWLLTPWWGRHDMLLLRYHLRCLYVTLGSVLLGLLIAPGHALAGSRLSGVIWPMGPTQVAQYAAVAVGVTIVLWLARLVNLTWNSWDAGSVWSRCSNRGG